jgi:PncC family amidohydrolase
MKLNDLSKSVGKLLTKKKLTISICESCTGGMLGSIITSIPGSSKYFRGGIIAYSNEVKIKIVGVNPVTLRKYGAVSAIVAEEMAKGVRKKLKTDVGIGITGIAGPGGGTKEKPVGLVYICLIFKRKRFIKRLLLKGNRKKVREKSCEEALSLLRYFLK